MANPSKSSGTKGETRVARKLSQHGIPTTRRALAGSSDKGDLCSYINGAEVTVEVKTGEQTQNLNKAKLRKWQAETLQESVNAGCPSMLVVLRYRRSFYDALVFLPNSQWANAQKLGSCWTMMYMDEFIDRFGEE